MILDKHSILNNGFNKIPIILSINLCFVICCDSLKGIFILLNLSLNCSKNNVFWQNNWRFRSIEASSKCPDPL